MNVRIFAEQPSSSAPQTARGFAPYSAANEAQRDVVVRHLIGYEAFAEMCVELGTDPSDLTSEIDACASFLRQSSDEIRSHDLQNSAAIFLGNVLVQQREDAHWIQYGSEFPSVVTRQHHCEPLMVLALLSRSDEPTFREIMTKIKEWIRACA
jgi:hypothetical protein